MISFRMAVAVVLGHAAMSTASAYASSPTAETRQVAAVAAEPGAAGQAQEPAAQPSPQTSLPAQAPTGSPPPAVALAAEKPKPAVTLSARIDLSSQTVTIAEHGKQVHTWKISSGTREFATPTGTFRPQWMAKMWFSKKYDDAPMPHSVFFKDGVALHATQAVHALGRPASHGCVRLAPANAEKFYALVQRHGMVHTQIQVFGTPKFAPVAVAKAPAQPGEAALAAQRMRNSRYAAGPGAAMAAAPASGNGSWFGASPYRYPGDPVPVRQVYRYGTH